MPSPIVATVAGGIGQAVAASSASRSASRASDAQIGLAYDQLARVDRENERLRGASRAVRDNNARDIRGNFRNIFADAGREFRRSEANAGDMYRRATGIADDAFNREIDTFTQTRDANLSAYDPFVASGRNALAALDYEMGTGAGPEGYQGIMLSPAARFAMEQGRDAIEAGAVSGGSPRSGATIAALERMRQGMAAQDRENQLNRLADIRNLGYDATGAQAGIRDAFASRYGASSQANAAALTGASNVFGGMRAANLSDLYNTRADAYNARTMGLTNTRNNYLASLQNAANLYAQGTSNATQFAANGYANRGNAQAAGAIGIGNALTGGIENYLAAINMQRYGQAPGASAGGGFGSGFGGIY